MRWLIIGLAFCALVFGIRTSRAVTIDYVLVGNPNNESDDEVMVQDGTTGYGSVDYTYNIGKYEVTNAQYAEFLNAVATVGDPNGLYNSDMNSGWYDIGGILQSGSGTEGNPWTYSTRTNRSNRPVNYVSWYDSLRFTNWLHNGQPTGVQDTSTTEDGAYNM